MVQKRLPRLYMQDMKDLRTAVTNLVAADEALKRSGLAAAPAIRTLIQGAIMVIGPLHDRAEPVYLEILSEQGPRTLQERAAAAVAADHQGEELHADQAEEQED
jgi:hypothetical protein